MAGATIVNPFLQPEQDRQLLITAEHGLFILLVSLILFIRIANLNFNTLHLDEAIYTTVGEAVLSGMLDQDATRWMFGSYLYPVLSTLTESMSGVVGLRALSALSLTAASSFIYLTARRLFGMQPALWAAFLFGLTGVSINLGQFAVLDALGVPLLAASLYCVVSAILSPTRQKAFLTAAGIIFSLCVLVKYIGILSLPGLVMAMLAVHLYQGRSLTAFITKMSWLSLIIPMVIILGIYGAYYARDLQEVFSGRFAYQFDSRGAILLAQLTEIGITSLLALVAIPFIMMKAFDELRMRHPGLLVLFAACMPILIVTVFLLPIYHIVSSNSRSLWKHEVYSLVFIAPLAGYGVARLIDSIRSITGKNTLKLRAVSAVVTVIGMFLFVSVALRQNAIFHASWPNSQRVIDFVHSQKLSPQSKVLASNYAIVDYYFDLGVTDRQIWTTPWDTESSTVKGIDVLRKAIQDCTYDLIVLDDYYAPELNEQVEPLVQKAGYRLTYNASEKLSTNAVIGIRVYNQQCKEARP